MILFVTWQYYGRIIIIISTTMFMVLSSWQSHCESSPGSFDECRMVCAVVKLSDRIGNGSEIMLAMLVGCIAQW